MNTVGKVDWQGLQLDYCAVTDMGQVRKLNEDHFMVSPELRLFCVADGMGGHTAGEFASQLALESVKAFVEYRLGHNVLNRDGIPTAWIDLPPLAGAAHFANKRVYDAANGKVMGSTLVAARFAAQKLEIVHAGDSRAYLWRQGFLHQLTVDHSLVQSLHDTGQITKEEMRCHPQRNVIIQAIGPYPEVTPHFQEFEVSRGDLLLLCSDGLTGMLQETELSQQLSLQRDVAEIASHLVSLANQAGGLDNITALLISIK